MGICGCNEVSGCEHQQGPERKHPHKHYYHQRKQNTKVDVYETLCPQQMPVHKGGKIKNWVGECRDVTPIKLQSQNRFKEHLGGGGGGSGWGWRVRMDVNEELKCL